MESMKPEKNPKERLTDLAEARVISTNTDVIPIVIAESFMNINNDPSNQNDAINFLEICLLHHIPINGHIICFAKKILNEYKEDKLAELSEFVKTLENEKKETAHVIEQKTNEYKTNNDLVKKEKKEYRKYEKIYDFALSIFYSFHFYDGAWNDCEVNREYRQFHKLSSDHSINRAQLEDFKEKLDETFNKINQKFKRKFKQKEIKLNSIRQAICNTDKEIKTNTAKLNDLEKVIKIIKETIAQIKEKTKTEQQNLDMPSAPLVTEEPTTISQERINKPSQNIDENNLLEKKGEVVETKINLISMWKNSSSKTGTDQKTGNRPRANSF